MLAAARELLAEAGPDALSMRALARRLDVAPNALYSHVTDKADLLDGVLHEVLGAVRTPDAGATDAVAALRALLTSTWDVLAAHPDLVPLYLVRQGARGPHAVRLGKVMDALLARAGVPPDEVDEARTVLVVHVLGAAAYATSRPAGPRRPPADARRTLARSLQWLLSGIVAGSGPAPPP